jgi:hypothetical protein
MQGINESTDFDAISGNDEQEAIEVWRHRTVDNTAGAPAWFAGTCLVHSRVHLLKE